jgi:hypothetical protein
VLCLLHCSYGYYVSLAWLPSYFQLALGLNIESSSLYTLIPYLVSCCWGTWMLTVNAGKPLGLDGTD